MTTVFKSTFVAFFCFLVNACAPGGSTETAIHSLKEGEAKATITIDGKSFYLERSIFKGTVDVTDQFFKVNLFDQFESNLIIGFGGENWYKVRPMERQVFADNQMAANVMIGKMTDPVNRFGEGYLMTEGYVSVKSLSEKELVIVFDGKVGKYEAMREPENWSTVKGTIFYRKPKISLTNLTKSQAYF